MSSLVLTLTETLRYRGAIGQWSWVLHRLTGLGVVFFLILHVIDTSWAVFYPGLYEEAIASYQSPLFTLGEFGLVAAVVYHAFNGLRIVLFDYRPQWWKYQQRAAYVVLALTALTLVPTFILMFSHVLKHYGEPGVFVLGLDRVLLSQMPFAAGFAVAIVAALILAVLVGLVVRDRDNGRTTTRAQGSRMERFWWSYMRISGLLIVPLVFGHLALGHVIQGVFDITVAGGPVAGVPQIANAGLIGDGINATGTSVEYVGERWNYLVAGVAIWRIYDVALLALVTIHGFNGLRYVLTDYTMSSPLLRRTANFACLIGATVLLVVGTGALIYTINQDAVTQACHSAEELGKTLSTECENLLGKPVSK